MISILFSMEKGRLIFLSKSTELETAKLNIYIADSDTISAIDCQLVQPAGG
jgi:hypothetical protein